MHKEVLVTVTGTRICDLGERETIELVTRGDYFLKNNSFYIVYAESEISGMQGTTTALKAEPGRVTLNRMGVSEFKQIFQQGLYDEGNYITPFGSMYVSVLPSRVQVDLTEAGGSINLEYELEIQRQKTGDHTLHITVEEVKLFHGRDS